MFRRLGVLTIFAIGMFTVFIACTEADKDGTPTIPPAEAKSFIDFAAMDGYDNPIIPGMKIDLASSDDVRWSGDLIDNHDNTSLFYTYVDQPDKSDNTEAVYRFGDNQFFGVEILGIGSDKKLKFIFDNMSDNKSGFFTTEGAVTFDPASTKNSIPASIDNFTNLAAGSGYKFVNNELFSLADHNLVANHNDNVLYTHTPHLIDNKTHAVYQRNNPHNPSQYIGVELVSHSNPRTMNFYYGGTEDSPTYFTKPEDVTFTSKATDKLPISVFMDNVAGKRYQLVIEDEGVLTTIGATGDIVHGDNTYEFVSSQNANSAIYQIKNTNQFFGVQINEGTLDLYFKNNSGTPAYWVSTDAMQGLTGADVIVATRTIGGALSYRVPSDNITAIDDQVPTSGSLSALYKNNTMYVAADNKTSGNPGILFTGIVDDIGIVGVMSKVFSDAVSQMTPDSLQLIGTNPYIISRNGSSVTMYNKMGYAIPIPSDGPYTNSIRVGSYAFVAKDADTLAMVFVGSRSVLGYSAIISSYGIQINFPAVSTMSLVTSIATVGESTYSANYIARNVVIYKLDSSADPYVSVDSRSNGKLLNINDSLYIVVDNSGTKEMYKLSLDTAELITGAILPMDIESIVADDKFIYVTSRASNGTSLELTAYTLEGTVLTKIVDEVAIDVVNVTPVLVSLGSDLGVVVIDVENIDGKNVIRYNNIVVSNTPFVMPTVETP